MIKKTVIPETEEVLYYYSPAEWFTTDHGGRLVHDVFNDHLTGLHDDGSPEYENAWSAWAECCRSIKKGEGCLVNPDHEPAAVRENIIRLGWIEMENEEMETVDLTKEVECLNAELDQVAQALGEADRAIGRIADAVALALERINELDKRIDKMEGGL